VCFFTKIVGYMVFSPNYRFHSVVYYLQGKEKYDVLEIHVHILYNVRQLIPDIRKIIESIGGS
jgi:hypothetical protein